MQTAHIDIDMTSDCICYMPDGDDVRPVGLVFMATRQWEQACNIQHKAAALRGISWRKLISATNLYGKYI